MCITGRGVVGSALAGTDRKNWLPLVEEMGVSELGLGACSLPFKGFDCGAVVSLLIMVATGGADIKTVVLICWKFRGDLGWYIDVSFQHSFRV